MTDAANWHVQAAWHYHQATKHSPESVRRSTYQLDWSNYPLPFKIYRNLPAERLPTTWQTSHLPALQAICNDGSRFRPDAILDRAALARLLYFSAGVQRVRQYGEMTVPYRAAACTGNLHHIELYLACGKLPDLDPGIYHFGPHDFSLRLLRAGDHRRYLAEATASHPDVVRAPVVLVATSMFWRNAWKYQARAYRHAFWDCGTILANLFALAAATELRHRLVLGFVDEEVNRLLAIDGRREAALALIALGESASEPPSPPPLRTLAPEVEPVSPREVEFPEIPRMHAASSLRSANEVRRWYRARLAPLAPPPSPTPSAAQRALPPAPVAAEPIEAVILRRGSTRRFSRTSISLPTFAAVLRAAATRIPADFQQGGPLTDVYSIVHAVEGLESGAYALPRTEPNLHLLQPGSFRSLAGHLALGQALAADAAANVYSLADLHRILPAYGNRGYRAAQLEGGIAGGKMYLTAFAQRIGATGLTFFDDEVTQFFSPHAAGKSVMFLTAVGMPHRRPAKAT